MRRFFRVRLHLFEDHRSLRDHRPLKDHRQLVAGAVSSAANTFAVLEKSGKILILPLTSHEDGGICSRCEATSILGDSVSELRSMKARQAASNLTLQARSCTQLILMEN